MIRWKIIGQEDRQSASIKTEEFTLRYPVGAVVTAAPDTLGIMVYTRKRDAVKFMQKLKGSMFLWCRRKLKIVRVQGIGRGTKPLRISQCLDRTSLRIFYWKAAASWSSPGAPPQGTICYKQVKVLD